MEPIFPFTEDELSKAGLIGQEVAGLTVKVLKTMREHPELLNLSLFTLQCINQRLDPISPRVPQSNVSTLPRAVSAHGPDEYERTTYYHGITADGDHPHLVYRSDSLTTPFPKPAGRYQNIAVKSLRGVYDTPLNEVWDAVGPQIRDLIKARRIDWSSVDPARFFTHPKLGEETKGSLGPVVIWVGVIPGSTSADTAHEVSGEILALLLKHGVKGVVVEWREAVLQRLAGPPLMPHVDSSDATHYVRRFLTPLLGVPLATKEMEEGTLTLWFHEGRDEHGNLSDRVFGVTNCHVLRKDTSVSYEHRSGAPMYGVRVCGERRFQCGLDEITRAIAMCGLRAHLWSRELIALNAKERQDADDMKAIRAKQHRLHDEFKAIADLEAFHSDVTKFWSHVQLYRNIGYVQCAAAVSVDVEGGTLYTSDWAAFVATEGKVKGEFEGNIVDLGSKYDPAALTRMFCPLRGGSTAFQFPRGRKLRIERCVTKEDLANLAGFDSEGHRCITVGKDGNTTDLTVGCYAGLVSFTKNNSGMESVELGMYNLDAEVFAAPGDSGSLVWCMVGGVASIVGQIHSGGNKGGLTNNHVTYCTPGWYLLDQIRKRFKYADFYRHTW